MRFSTATAMALILTFSANAANAQLAAKFAEEKRLEKERNERKEMCAKLSGIAQQDCLDEEKARQRQVVSAKGPQISKANDQLVKDAFAAGNAKQAAKDYTGAIADYQSAASAVPTHPGIPQINLATAAAYRAQSVQTFNSGLTPGAGAAVQAQAAAAAAPGFKQALAAAAKTAAAIAPAAAPATGAKPSAAAVKAAAADAEKNATMARAVGVELRESASLLYQIDKAATFTVPRDTIDVEVTWLRTWLASTPAPGAAETGKYGIAVAAGLYARDRAAGLALADEIYAKSSADTDAALNYADLIASAKLPAGDPRKAKASAALATLETGGTTNDTQKSKIRRIKAALAAPA